MINRTDGQMDSQVMAGKSLPSDNFRVGNWVLVGKYKKTSLDEFAIHDSVEQKKLVFEFYRVRRLIIGNISPVVNFKIHQIFRFLGPHLQIFIFHVPPFIYVIRGFRL